MYLGSWDIDNLLTFPANTHRFDTGAGTDADSVPSYRIYEDETGTAILTGSMAKLDDSNTVGFYSEQITLSAANGFEAGKSYTIYISATVNSVTATVSHTFQVAGKVEIAKAVWDRLLTGATHNIANSAGRRLREVNSGLVHSGTAQAGSTNTITLDTGASSTDGTYDPSLVRLVGGTGSGQARMVTHYTGSTRVAVVDRDWRTTPDSSTEFQILAAPNLMSTNEGLAQGGGASSITLNASASSVNDAYTGQTVVIRTGTGQDQSRLITAYNGTTKEATVAQAWVTQPTSSSGYMILPTGRAMVAGFVDDTITSSALAASAITEIQSGLATAASIAALNNLSTAQVNAEMLDVLTTDTYAEPASVPAATSSLKDKINWLFALARNKLTQTSATQTLRNDADSGNIGTSTVSDDGTTATRGEWS